jgi:hypothetical protein
VYGPVHGRRRIPKMPSDPNRKNGQKDKNLEREGVVDDLDHPRRVVGVDESTLTRLAGAGRV